MSYGVKLIQRFVKFTFIFHQILNRSIIFNSFAIFREYKDLDLTKLQSQCIQFEMTSFPYSSWCGTPCVNIHAIYFYVNANVTKHMRLGTLSLCFSKAYMLMHIKQILDEPKLLESMKLTSFQRNALKHTPIFAKRYKRYYLELFFANDSFARRQGDGACNILIYNASSLHALFNYLCLTI